MGDVPLLLNSGDYGSRAGVAPSQAQSVQSTDVSAEVVQIQSMDALAEVVEAATEAVGDIGSITLGDIEKLLKDTFVSKQDITDAIRDALTQPVFQAVRDSSVLVKSQVKADSVRGSTKGESVASVNSRKNSGGKSSDDLSWLQEPSEDLNGLLETFKRVRGKIFSFYEGYHKLLGGLTTLVNNPLKILDMGADFAGKGIDFVGKGLVSALGKAFKKEDKTSTSGSERDSFGRSESFGQSKSFVSGSRGYPQTASVRNEGLGSFFGSGLGQGSGYDYPTAAVRGESPFSSFAFVSDVFSDEGSPLVSAPVVPSPVVSAPAETVSAVPSQVVSAPVETVSVVPSPVETVSAVPSPVVSAPVVPSPMETVSAVPSPAEPVPVSPAPVVSYPAESALGAPAQMEIAPTVFTPVEPVPVVSAPVESVSVATARMESAPVAPFQPALSPVSASFRSQGAVGSGGLELFSEPVVESELSAVDVAQSFGDSSFLSFLNSPVAGAGLYSSGATFAEGASPVPVPDFSGLSSAGDVVPVPAPDFSVSILAGDVASVSESGFSGVDSARSIAPVSAPDSSGATSVGGFFPVPAPDSSGVAVAEDSAPVPGPDFSGATFAGGIVPASESDSFGAGFFNNSFPLPGQGLLGTTFAGDAVSEQGSSGVAFAEEVVPAPALALPGGSGDAGESKGVVSSADNLSVDTMESDIKANSMLFHTFDEPEKSDFGKFLEDRVSINGPGAQGGQQGKGLLATLFEGAILAGLLFALPFIVDKVIPFVQDTLIPFIKGPFSDFARVLGGFVKEGFDTVWPYVGQAFSAIGGWLSNNSEKIWSAVGKTFSVIGSVLSIVGPFVWGAVEGVFTAMGNWWDANGTGVLVAIKGIFTSIGNWVSENKEGIWNSISGAISSFGDFITEIFWPFLKEVGAPLFISNLMNVFGAVGDLFRLLSGDLSVGSFLDSLATRWLNTVNNSLAGLGVVASGVLGGGFVKDNFLLSGATELAQGYAIVGRNNAGVNLGSSFYLDRSTGEMYRVPAKESTVLEGEGVVKGIGPHDSRGWGEVVDSSKLPSSATMVGVVEALRPEETWENFGIPYVRSEENSLGPEPQPQKIDDGVITSDGKVIQTSPEDNIYAFKGDVSIAPANSMREFSGSPVSYNNSQTHSTSNVTNNYISQSNFNLADLFPASEFDPVGV